MVLLLPTLPAADGSQNSDVSAFQEAIEGSRVLDACLLEEKLRHKRQSGKPRQFCLKFAMQGDAE
jgi:hypothetical protein